MSSPAPDKSPKGNLDAPIIPLLNSINSHPSYFTTSSCSGRISILSQPVATPSAVKKKAGGGFWFYVSHDPVQPSALSALLFHDQGGSCLGAESDTETRFSDTLVFRFEPLIIAVECKNIEAAQWLVSMAISCGFRESGITSVSKRVIIAIRCSIRLEVPLGTKRKLMVSPEYVEYLAEMANEKMAANRKRTDLLHEKLMTSEFGEHGNHVDGQTNCKGGEAFLEMEKMEPFDDSQKNELRVLGTKLNKESNLQQDQNDGMLEEGYVHLFSFKLVGEPIERLWLWGHSACALNEKEIIIFGGFGGIGRHARRNELLLLDTVSHTVEIIASAGPPSPRLGHTCSVIGDSIYIIGGRSDPTNILNEVWMFNYKTKDWVLLQCSGCFFPARHRHTAVVTGTKIYVYGGINNEAILSTLYAFDTNTYEWSEIETIGDQPGPRHSHSMVADGLHFYVFGGHNGETALNDLYSFDVQKSQWRNIRTDGKPPRSRFSHLMFIYSKCLFVLGGCPVGESQEVFLLDIQSMSWRSLVIKSLQGLFVRSTSSVIGDDLIIIGGGAACYAFGTKFSEPLKINLAHLMCLLENKVPNNAKEKHLKCHNKHDYHHYNPDGSVEKAYVPGEMDVEHENSGASWSTIPYVLSLVKNYAKVGKDILKKFGWLDPERQVYSLDGGKYICFPIAREFCCLWEDKQEHRDQIVDLSTFVSLSSHISRNLVKDISSSDALKLLAACGATKLVDENAKLKKKPSSPHKVMTEAVTTLLDNHGLPLELLEQVPSRWEKLGDIIVLPVGSFNDPVWDSIKEELWPLVAESLGTHRLARQGRIAQTGTRDSNLEILWGKDGWVDHSENGIHYCFDTTKCMFSWGNLSEKLRMARLDCRGEVVIDLFAGVGYFTLPFLVRANAKMVYACEWNPESVKALHHNLQINNVSDRCVVLDGDNKDTSPGGVADRVCLGLLPSSECSWITAVRALRDVGGILHIHGNVKDSEESSWVKYVLQSISEIAFSQGRVWDIVAEHVERVKWYAPHLRHIVVDVRCRLKSM